MTIKLLSNSIDLASVQIRLEDLEDCQRFAEQLAQCISIPLCIALSGTLGAGKTQWTRFFATSLGAPPDTISSPTFMLVHEYSSTPPIFHLDTYRVGDEDEMLELGIEEMFDSDAITVVEWADRFPNLLPQQTIQIHMETEGQSESRIIAMRASGTRAKKILSDCISQWS